MNITATGPSIRIAIAARKGGVGKTTTATGVADLLAFRGLRTALIDLDPQSNGAFALGVDPAAPGTAQLLLGQPVVPQEARAGLVVFPGGPDLTNHRIAGLDAVELRELVQRMDVDAVVFDCPPGNEHLERQALVAASCALLVLDAHPFAMVGAQRVLESINLRKSRGRGCPDHLGVVACRIDMRRSADRHLEADLAGGFAGLPVLRIRQDAQLAAASADHIPVSALSADNRGRIDLEALTSWILERHQWASPVRSPQILAEESGAIAS